MKKIISIMAGTLMSFSFMANAQETPMPIASTTTPTTSTWDYKKNPTVDSINAKYANSMAPQREAMTIEKVFPAIGQYESSINTDASAVSITLDEQSKGIVWIDGLPQGKIKAYLRKSPATYKIPAQKTEDGKDVAEGTLIFDKDANTLSIIIGKPYDVADPAAAFANPEEEVVTETKTKTAKSKVKTKKVVKPWTYVGTKIQPAIEVVPADQPAQTPAPMQ